MMLVWFVGEGYFIIDHSYTIVPELWSVSYYDTTPWGYIHKNRKFKEFIKKLEETITQMEQSNEITSETFKKINAVIDDFKS